MDQADGAGVELFDIAPVRLGGYCYSSIEIPDPYLLRKPRLSAKNRGEPAVGGRHGGGSASRPGLRPGNQKPDKQRCKDGPLQRC